MSKNLGERFGEAARYCYFSVDPGLRRGDDFMAAKNAA